MGRIDDHHGIDKTLERRHIQQMLRNIEGYELVKSKQHPRYRTAKSFYEGQGLCKQNFLKYYKRFIHCSRDPSSLLPHKVGRRFKEVLEYHPNVVEKIKEIRSKGYNRYDLCDFIYKEEKIEIKSTTMYRLLKKLGLNRLNFKIKEEKRKIVKKEAGELGHIDIHYVTKGTVKETGDKKLYILGIIDDYSRVCWLEVVDSIKAIDVMFASMDLLLLLRKRYGITFKEIMSDNGSEFASKNNPSHPFEKMLKYYKIKHRYIQAFKPQTNGKIERFWKTLENELLDGETFDTLEELKHYIQGYCVYYNEHRTHQGINLKMPIHMIQKQTSKEV